MKSLPSTYRGVLFRSRLEARWAAYFDHQCIRWVYEPEGFDTGNGNYLPDFLLPDLKTYVEVKPGPNQIDASAIWHVAISTGSNFLVLDSPILECRAYPYLALLSDGTFDWLDMCWCASSTYLGKKPRDSKQRFYTCIGEFHPMTESGDCFCGGSGDAETFTRLRSMRFNNGVAT